MDGEGPTEEATAVALLHLSSRIHEVAVSRVKKTASKDNLFVKQHSHCFIVNECF